MILGLATFHLGVVIIDLLKWPFSRKLWLIHKAKFNLTSGFGAGYGIDMAASGIGSYQTDGNLCKKGLCFAILEVKTELASGQADPLFQAASYHCGNLDR